MLIQLLTEEGQICLPECHTLSHGHRRQPGSGNLIAVPARVGADITQRLSAALRDGEKLTVKMSLSLKNSLV